MLVTERRCYNGGNHSLIVTRWQKLDRADIAELFICQHCMRIYEWQTLVECDATMRDVEKAERFIDLNIIDALTTI